MRTEAATAVPTPWRRRGLILLGGLACLLLGFLVRCENAGAVFTARGTDFLDADCYTRMERVRQILADPWHPVRWHTFENAPIGIRPHTTSLLDYTIAAIATALRPWSGERAPDLAGAWVSPLLGLLSMLYLLWWSLPYFGWPVRIGILAAHALMPAVAWSQNIGRPDHQSLILLLVGIGLTMETHLRRWPERRDYHIAAGMAWGAALWVSLFEPALMLLLTIGVGIAQERFRFFAQRRLWGAALLGLFLGGCVIDGWPIYTNGAGQWAHLRWWWQGIAELQGMSPKKFFLWFGLWLAAVPFLFAAARHFGKVRWASAAPLLVPLLAVSALACWQMRWTALLGWLLCVTAVPLLGSLPGCWWQLGVSMVFSIPMIAYAGLSLATPPLSQPPHTALRIIAGAMKQPGIILAPWWISPPLLYFSGYPSVASSSHESLDGNIASAQFFEATDADAARSLAAGRHVRWIVAGPAESVLVEAARLLRGERWDVRQMPKRPHYASTMAARLQTARALPPWLRLRAVAGQYRLYELLSPNDQEPTP